MTASSKKCPQCGNYLQPASNFYANRSMADGLSGYCKKHQSAATRSSVKKNPAPMRKATKKWKDKNPKKVAAQKKRHNKKNPQKKRQHTANYRKRAKAAGIISAYDWNTTCLAFNNACAYCGATGMPLEKEHYIPIISGGLTELGNIVPACKCCNGKKTYRPALEFLTAEHGEEAAKVKIAIIEDILRDITDANYVPF